MVECKNCKEEKVIKNGTVRSQQRYRCKICGYNFIEGDRRENRLLPAKKALAVILYALGKGSFNMQGKIFGHSPSLIYRWIKEEAETLPATKVSGDIKEMEFDEMWHFIGSKKRKSGSSKRWIVAQGELWPGYSAVVMLQHSGDSITK